MAEETVDTAKLEDVLSNYVFSTTIGAQRAITFGRLVNYELLPSDEGEDSTSIRVTFTRKTAAGPRIGEEEREHEMTVIVRDYMTVSQVPHADEAAEAEQ